MLHINIMHHNYVHFNIEKKKEHILLWKGYSCVEKIMLNFD